jgi:hypothetical protein
MSFVICCPSRYQIGVLAQYGRVIINETRSKKGVGQYHDGKESAMCLLFIKVKF